MIEEEVYVAEVDDESVWVVKNRLSGCPGCKETCVSSLASRFFTEKQFRLRIVSKLAVHPGDKVLIGIKDDHLVKISFTIYLLPLFSFFFGALAGKYLFSSDLASALLGLSGLGICTAVLKYFRLFGWDSFQPVILRKLY